MEFLLLWGFPTRVVSKYVLQSLLIAYLYRQKGRSQVRPPYVGPRAYSILADCGQFCVRFDSVVHAADFHLSDSVVLFLRLAVSFLQSLSSDKERVLCSSGKRCPVMYCRHNVWGRRQSCEVIIASLTLRRLKSNCTVFKV